MPASPSAVSVLICTYNRADLLRTTLASLARSVARRPWEILVVDNNSTDDTRGVVHAFATASPVPVTYLFEGRQVLWRRDEDLGSRSPRTIRRGLDVVSGRVGVGRDTADVGMRVGHAVLVAHEAPPDTGGRTATSSSVAVSTT